MIFVVNRIYIVVMVHVMTHCGTALRKRMDSAIPKHWQTLQAVIICLLVMRKF